MGEGGSGTFEGDLIGDGTFDERSPRGCFVFTGDIMIIDMFPSRCKGVCGEKCSRGVLLGVRM